MRYFAPVLLLAFALSFAFVSHGQSQIPVPSQEFTIRVRATIEDVRVSGSERVNVYLLWNKSVRARPLGHGFLSCLRIGEGGLLGGGVSLCRGIFTMPLGKLTVFGPQHRRFRFTLVVTGGSQLYAGKSGTMTARRSGPGDYSLIFRLT